jgi:gluconolactonase
VGAADGSLLFAQEQPSRVSAIAPDGRVSILVDQTHGAGALAIDARGRIFAAQRTCTDPGLHEPCNEPTAIGIVYPQSERRTLANMVDGHSLGRVNDLVVGRSGNIYFTSGGAYFLNAGGTVTAFGEDLRTNGIILSRDEKTLYVTNGSTIAAFDVGSDGTPSTQRAFAMLAAGGSGDGMTIDDHGRIYVTSPPGVQVFDASGRYVGLIPTPRPVISAAFAGTDKRTLYVVGSGAADESGHEIVTPEGVRNNAKTIYRLPMASRGFRGRPK